MLQFLVLMAIETGDAEKVPIGKVDQHYLNSLQEISHELESGHANRKELEKRHDEIWEQICNLHGFNHHERLLTVNKTTNELHEILITNRDLYDELVSRGQVVRMKEVN